MTSYGFVLGIELADREAAETFLSSLGVIVEATSTVGQPALRLDTHGELAFRMIDPARR